MIKNEWFTCLEHPEWIFQLPRIVSGNQASIYTACQSTDKNCAFIAKFYILEDDNNEWYFDNEVKAYSILNTDARAKAIAPKMHDCFKCHYVRRVYGIIILKDLEESADIPPSAKVFEDYVKLTHDLLVRHGITQGDIVRGNIMYDKSNRPYLVDFEMAAFDRPLMVPNLRDFYDMATQELKIDAKTANAILRHYFPEDKRLH